MGLSLSQLVTLGTTTQRKNRKVIMDQDNESKSARSNRIALDFANPDALLESLKRDMTPRPITTGEYISPRNATEEKIASIWQDLIGVERVGVLDDFFSLGGESLIAVQALSRIRDRFRVEIPLTALFTDDFTVAALAERVNEELLSRDSKHDTNSVLGINATPENEDPSLDPCPPSKGEERR